MCITPCGQKAINATFIFFFFIKVHCNFLFPSYIPQNASFSQSVPHWFYMCEQMYGLIWLTDLRSKMDTIDLLIMLTSAVCHDLDHTGYNNAYQVDGSPFVPSQTATPSRNLMLRRLIKETPSLYLMIISDICISKV